jgi:hypothetical protein
MKMIIKNCFRMSETDEGVPSRDSMGTAEEEGGIGETKR